MLSRETWHRDLDRDEQRQHVINGVPTGIRGNVEVRMLQMGADRDILGEERPHCYNTKAKMLPLPL